MSNQKFIDAFNEGETIEWRFTDYQRKNDDWIPLNYSGWNNNFLCIEELKMNLRNVEYRIKPKSIPFNAVVVL